MFFCINKVISKSHKIVIINGEIRKDICHESKKEYLLACADKYSFSANIDKSTDINHMLNDAKSLFAIISDSDIKQIQPKQKKHMDFTKKKTGQFDFNIFKNFLMDINQVVSMLIKDYVISGEVLTILTIVNRNHEADLTQQNNIYRLYVEVNNFDNLNNVSLKQIHDYSNNINTFLQHKEEIKNSINGSLRCSQKAIPYNELETNTKCIMSNNVASFFIHEVTWSTITMVTFCSMFNFRRSCKISS